MSRWLQIALDVVLIVALALGGIVFIKILILGLGTGQ